MMDLPLMMAAPAAKASDGTSSPTSRSGDPVAFEATLMTLLGGDAGKEVVEMVEALELLADLEQDHEELTADCWSLPALLAMRTQDEGAEHAGSATEVDLHAILDEVATLDEGDAPDLDDLGELVASPVPGDTEVEGDAEVDGDTEGIVPGDTDALDAADGDALADAEALEDTDARGDGETETPSTPAAPASDGRQTASLDNQADDEDAEALARETRTRGVAGSGEENRASDTATRASDAARSGSRNEAPVDRVPTASASVDQPINSDAAKQAATRAPVMSSAVLRVMEAVERLETLPPPRQLTIDLGDVRVRVAMEDGQVRLTLLEGDGESAEELLEDARDQLAQRGFDLSGDGDERPGAEGRSDDDRKTEAPSHRRASQRIPAGLRL